MRAFEQRKKDSPASTSFFWPQIQKKLKTGTAGDQFEVEADKVADKVASNNSSGGGLLQSKEKTQQKPLSETISSVQAKDMKEEEPLQKKPEEKEEPVQKKEEEKEPVQKKEQEEEKPVQKKEETVQAKCADCENEDKKVQKKENGKSEKDDSGIEGRLNQSKGSGSPMDKGVRTEMESKFGSDFSNVNIHTNTNAVQMSQDLGAQAFTSGNDVYFNKGKYNPNTKEGKHLLAHELTHTVQQTGAKQKTPTIQKSTLENHPEDLQAEKPENPQFKNNPPLEKANDNEMLIGTGHKGGYVAEIQSGLMKAGQNLNQYGADGDFGSETRNAVYSFQIENQLQGKDGIVGPETMGALDNKMVGQKGGKKGGSSEAECCAEAFRLPQRDNEFNIDDFVLSQQTFCTKGNFKIRSTANWVTPHSATHYHIIITALQGGTVNKPTRRFDIGKTETQTFTVTTNDCLFFKVQIQVINPPGSPNLKGIFHVIK